MKGLSIRAASREVEKLTNGQVTAKRAEMVYNQRTPALNEAPGQPEADNTEYNLEDTTERDSAGAVGEQGLSTRAASREVEKLTGGQVTEDRARNVYSNRALSQF